jgi:hypothetical protein
MIKVFVESPYKGDTYTNRIYLKRAMMDCISRGETPFASHLIYTQILDDNVKEERLLGISLGEPWRDVSNYTVFYTDYGISDGMLKALDVCRAKGIVVEYRTIGKNEKD